MGRGRGLVRGKMARGREEEQGAYKYRRMGCVWKELKYQRCRIGRGVEGRVELGKWP
jgi:hypothetical protein